MPALLAIITILFVRVAIDANHRGYTAKFVVTFTAAWAVLFLVGI